MEQKLWWPFLFGPNIMIPLDTLLDVLHQAFELLLPSLLLLLLLLLIQTRIKIENVINHNIYVVKSKNLHIIFQFSKLDLRYSLGFSNKQHSNEQSNELSEKIHQAYYRVYLTMHYNLKSIRKRRKKYRHIQQQRKETALHYFRSIFFFFFFFSFLFCLAFMILHRFSHTFAHIIVTFYRLFFCSLLFVYFSILDTVNTQYIYIPILSIIAADFNNYYYYDYDFQWRLFYSYKIGYINITLKPNTLKNVEQKVKIERERVDASSMNVWVQGIFLNEHLCNKFEWNSK